MFDLIGSVIIGLAATKLGIGGFSVSMQQLSAQKAAADAKRSAAAEAARAARNYSAPEAHAKAERG